MQRLSFASVLVAGLLLACPTPSNPKTDGGLFGSTGGGGPSGGGFNAFGGGQAVVGGGGPTGGQGGGGGGAECTGFPQGGSGGGAVFICPFTPVRADVFFPNDPHFISLRAPVPECRAIALSASATVTATDGSQVPLLSAPVATADIFGGVTTTIGFSPPDAGTYLVHALFEPSLGEAMGSVRIAPTFNERGVVVTGVDDCTDTPWPLGAETIACETSSGIVLHSADGGRVDLDAINLVTAGDVVWSLRDAGTSYTLQRHVWSGSSLSLTDEWPGEFSAERIRGLHTRDLAIRLRAPLAQHRFLMVARTGAAVQEALIDDALDLHDAGTIFWSATGRSDSSTLVAFTNVAWKVTPPLGGRDCGFDALVVALDPQGFGFGAGLPSPAHPTPVPPDREFESWPLWLDIAGRTVLVSSTPSVFTEWPLDRIVRVGPTHVVLTADGGYLVSPIEP